jgi:hypothetical protein
MAHVSTVVPIDHHPAIHQIDTRQADEPRPLTLLELIDAVSEVSESEQEVVATVTYMLNSGRIRLAGSFRGTPVEKLCG